MKGSLVLCISISLVSCFPRAQEDDVGSMGDVSLDEADSQDDMMAADRVMAIGKSNVSIKCLEKTLDEGKEAFQDMMSAVNNADERVNGISGDIEKTLNKAVS